MTIFQYCKNAKFEFISLDHSSLFAIIDFDSHLLLIGGLTEDVEYEEEEEIQMRTAGKTESTLVPNHVIRFDDVTFCQKFISQKHHKSSHDHKTFSIF